MLNNYFSGAPNIVGVQYTVFNNEVYIIRYFDEKGQSVSLEDIYNCFLPYAQVPFSIVYVSHQNGLYLPIILYNDSSSSPTIYTSLQFVPVTHESEDVWTNAQTVSNKAASYNLIQPTNTVSYAALTQNYYNVYNYLIQMYIQSMGTQVQGVQAGTPTITSPVTPVLPEVHDVSNQSKAANTKKKTQIPPKKSESHKDVPNSMNTEPDKVILVHEIKSDTQPSTQNQEGDSIEIKTGNVEDSDLSDEHSTVTKPLTTEQQLQDRNEQLRKLLNSFNDLKDSYKNLESTLSECAKERDGLKTKTIDLENQVKDLSSKIIGITSELNGTLDVCDQYVNDLDATKEELKEVKVKNLELIAALNDEKGRVSEATDKLHAMQADIEVSKSQNESEKLDYEARLGEYDVLINDYKDKISGLNSELEDMTSKYMNTQKAYNEVIEFQERSKSVSEPPLDYHDMYEKSVQHGRDLIEKYESAKEQWRIEKDILIRHYQDEIIALGREHSLQLIQIIKDCMTNPNTSGRTGLVNSIEADRENTACETESQTVQMPDKSAFDAERDAFELNPKQVVSPNDTALSEFNKDSESVSDIEAVPANIGYFGEETETDGIEDKNEFEIRSNTQDSIESEQYDGDAMSQTAETETTPEEQSIIPVHISNDNFESISDNVPGFNGTVATANLNIPNPVAETAQEKLERDIREATARANKHLKNHVSTLDIMSDPHAVHTPKYKPIEIAETPNGFTDIGDKSVKTTENAIEFVDGTDSSGGAQADGNNDMLTPPDVVNEITKSTNSGDFDNHLNVVSTQFSEEFNALLSDIINPPHGEKPLNSNFNMDLSIKSEVSGRTPMSLDEEKERDLENMSLPTFDAEQVSAPKSPTLAIPSIPPVLQPANDFDSMLGDIVGINNGASMITPKKKLGTGTAMKSMLGGTQNPHVVSIDLSEDL